jgi:hypothetical protein
MNKIIDNIKDFFGNIFDKIKDFFASVVGRIGDFFGNIFGHIGDFFSTVFGGIRDFFVGNWAKVLVGLLLVVTVCCFVVISIVGYNDFKAGKYSQSDVEDAYRAGELSGKAYRDYIDGLIAGIQGEVDGLGDGVALDVINDIYGSIVDIDNRLAEQGGDIEGLASQKLSALQSLRTSLNNLKTSYNSELSSLNLQLVSLNTAISNLENTDADNLDQISGFTFAKVYVEAQITNVNGIIAEIDSQIEVLDIEIGKLS